MRFFNRGKPEETNDDDNTVIGYELTVCECGPDARPFEGVPTAEQVREGGAPSLFTDYTSYPGGYPQAVRDWRNGEYSAPAQDDEWNEDDADEESASEPEPRKKFLGLF